MPVKVVALIYCITTQEATDTQEPTTTPRFSRTHGRINLKIIDDETKAGEALYKRATISLYSDS